MTDDERRRDQNARKAKSREKTKREQKIQDAHDKECGKEVLELKFEAYRGTLEQIDRLKATGGFDDVNELLTIMIRNADRQSKDRQLELLKI